MKNENLFYALSGAAVVALAWIASATLTPLVAFGIYTIAAVIAVTVQDYRNSAKSLK